MTEAKAHEVAMTEAEKIRPLIAHVLSVHKGDGDAKETTLALLLEHLYWQRQAGIREGADVARSVAAATEAKGSPVSAHALRVLADSLDLLARKNLAGHVPFGTTPAGRANPAAAKV